MSDEELEKVLRRLREAYIAESPQRLAELEAQLALVESGQSPALSEMARLFHRLAGSGGSYGVQGVTESARAGERLADELARASAEVSQAHVDQLRSHIASLGAAFEAAGREPPPDHF